MTTVILSITGMHCHNCETHLERILGATEGVKLVEPDLLSRSAYVEYDERVCGTGELAEAVQQAGFQVDGLETVAARS